ncbi:hypothetical protein KR054_003469 [Drosophila jambulina]|nr:hypothetical protein KR054_003469 [Drosophila jambulina]
MNPATQPEFLVEKITGKRYWNGRPQVQVKWQGYPSEENTWEPMENIGNCMVLLADFEAELFRSKERKKRLRKALSKNKASDEKLPGATQATTQDAAAPVERSVIPRSNLTNSVIGTTPKPNTSHKMGKHKDVAPNKLDPAPSSSFGKRALLKSALLAEAVTVLESSDEDTVINVEIISKGASRASSVFPESGSQLLKATKETIAAKPQKEANKNGDSIKTESKKMRRHSQLAPLEDPIEKALKSIHSNPMVMLPSSPQLSQQLEKKCQIVQKKSRKKSEMNESDDDSDAPLMPRHKKFEEGSDWGMPLRKAPFGLARGLELDNIVHIFKVADKLFMFVTWKGCSATDVVPLDELKLVYPVQVIQYFENMKRTGVARAP